MAFSPDYLIHGANLILLAAFVVRDMLLLRILFVTGSFVALGAYFLLSPPLWSAIGWTCVYILIHSYWIYRILMERRPVVLNADEQKLHDLAFASLDPRKFAALLSFGEWRDIGQGEYFCREGDQVSGIAIPISGVISMWMGDTQLSLLRPGQLIGTAVTLTSGVAPCDAVVEKPCRYIVFSHPQVHEFLAKDPELRDQLHSIANQDLSAKVLELAMRAAKVDRSATSISVPERGGLRDG